MPRDYLAEDFPEYAAAASTAIAQPAQTDEQSFQKWYAVQSKKTGINPNPDDPKHHYDYRAAFRAGAEPNAEGHWPSQFKAPDHPNRFVDGVDTITGLPAARDYFSQEQRGGGGASATPSRQPATDFFAQDFKTTPAEGVLPDAILRSGNSQQPIGQRLFDTLVKGKSFVPHGQERQALREIGVTRSKDDSAAHAQNVLALSKELGATPYEVEREYHALTRTKGTTGMTADPSVVDMASIPITGVIAAGLITHPLATVMGVAGFSAVEEADRAITAWKTKQPYKPFRSDTALEAMTPDDASDATHQIVEAIDLIGKGALVGGLGKKAPRIAEFLTRQVVEQHNLPRTVHIAPEKIRSIFQTGEGISPQEQELVSAMGLTGAQFRDALRAGVTIEVPTEKIVQIADRPWWKKVKEAVGIRPEMPVTRTTRVGAPREAPLGLPSPAAASPPGGLPVTPAGLVGPPGPVGVAAGARPGPAAAPVAAPTLTMTPGERQVIIARLGGAETQTPFGPAGQLSDKDLQRLEEAEKLKAAARAKKAKVVKPSIELLPEQDELAQAVIADVAAGEAGRRVPVPGSPEGEFMGIPSSFPAYFKNKGYTKADTLNIFKKARRGELLTAQQLAVFNDLIEGKRQEMAAEKEQYDESVRAESQTALKAGGTAAQLDEAQSAVESEAQSEFEAENLGEQGLEQGPLPEGATEFPAPSEPAVSRPLQNAQQTEADGNAVVRSAKPPGNLSKGTALAEQLERLVNVPSNASLTSNDNPSGAKAAVDRVVTGPDSGSDVFRSDALLRHGYGSLDVPTQSRVFKAVVSLVSDDEVFKSVVHTIPIPVMNQLMGSELAAQRAFNDKSVFIHALSTNDDLTVRGRAIEALVRGSALAVTESGSPDLGRPLENRGAAVETPQGVGHESATSPFNASPLPSQEQIRVGNYKHGHVTIQGFDVTIENPIGSVRSGISNKGKPWSTKMQYAYGYIRGTEGKDGEQVDVYLGPHPESQQVYVVDQVKPGTETFDEHKAMLGFDSEDAALQGYLDNYEPGWQGMGAITPMPMEQFREWVQSRQAKKPAAKADRSPTMPTGLPRELSGSKPRYGYQDKWFRLAFPDDAHLALYTIGQTTPNKAHAKFIDYLHGVFPGESDVQLAARAAAVRESIKPLAKAGASGSTLNVPATQRLTTKAEKFSERIMEAHDKETAARKAGTFKQLPGVPPSSLEPTSQSTQRVELPSGGNTEKIKAEFSQASMDNFRRHKMELEDALAIEGRAPAVRANIERQLRMITAAIEEMTPRMAAAAKSKRKGKTDQLRQELDQKQIEGYKQVLARLKVDLSPGLEVDQLHEQFFDDGIASISILEKSTGRMVHHVPLLAGQSLAATWKAALAEQRRVRTELSKATAEQLRTWLKNMDDTALFDRSDLINEAQFRGVDLILKELGWPTDRKALYRNIYSGREEPLGTLLNDDQMLGNTVSDAFWYRAEIPEDANIWSLIEHWEPAVGENLAKQRYQLEQMQREIEQLEGQGKKKGRVLELQKLAASLAKKLNLPASKPTPAGPASLTGPAEEGTLFDDAGSPPSPKRRRVRSVKPGRSETAPARAFPYAPGRALRVRFVQTGTLPLVGAPITSPEDIAFIFGELGNRAQEHIYLLAAKDGQPIAAIHAGLGTLNSSLLHPLQALILPIQRKANELWIVHNHPSGDPTPSEQDIQLTRRFSEMLGQQPTNITLKGHVVIEGGRFGFISPSGVEMRTRAPRIPVGTVPVMAMQQYLTPSRRTAPIDSAEMAAAYAKSLIDPDRVPAVVMALDTRMHLVGALPLPKLTSGQQMAREIIRRLALVNAQQFILVASPEMMPDRSSLYGLGKLLKSYSMEMLDALMVTEGRVLRAEGVPEGKKGTIPGGPIAEKPAKYKRIAPSGGTDAEHGVYATVETAGAGAGGAPVPVEFGGMDLIRPLELPEIVRLQRTLTGDVAKLRRMNASLGRAGANSYMVLDPRIFLDQRAVDAMKDRYANSEKPSPQLLADLAWVEANWKPELASRVLAHELGHLIDRLPEDFIARGNLIGRALSTVKTFLSHTFGTLDNKELKAELIALSKFWKPFDEEKVPGTYLTYRKSPRELYADFISVLFNAPAKAHELAPHFYQAFFENLDRKPEVKAELASLYDLLAGTPDEMLRAREDDITTMFERGEQLFRQRQLQKLQSQKSILFRLKYELLDRNIALLERRDARRRRQPIRPEEDPKYLIEELSMIGSKVHADLMDFQPIYESLNKAGVDFAEEFGQYLFLKRVAGERSGLANPLGHTAETAERQLQFLQESVGPEKWKAIEQATAAMRAWFKRGNAFMHEHGRLTDEQFEALQGNDTYAPFRVLKYYKEWVSAGVIRQAGTLEDIGNPATAMVLKKVAMVRAAERNRITKGVGHWLLEDPTDATPATVIAYPGVPPHVAPKDGWDAIIWQEQGEWRGAYVDPYIAESFRRDHSREIESVGKLLSQLTLNRAVFRPLYITFNLGFQSFNLIRDFQRTWKNAPGLTMLQALRNYKRAAPHAWRRVAGRMDPLIQQMEREGALHVTYNDLLNGQTDEDLEIEAILKQHNLLEGGKPAPELLKPVIALLRAIRFMGDVIETIPKVAGYQALEGLPREERAYRVRNHLGTPNFKRQGHAYAVYNNAWLFSGIIKEGIRGDYETAVKDPKTRAGWWWKTAKVSLLPKVLMALMAAGYFGKRMQDGMNDATEYDKTNYTIIPVGEDGAGKSLYLRIPQDETGRLLGGLFWKTLSQRSPQDVLSFTGGQLPSLSPLFGILGNWLTFAQGRTPHDAFRGQDIVTEDELKAGGADALLPMVRWTLNQSGWVKLNLHDRAQDQTLLERTITTTPVVNRWLRVTSYGRTEQAREAAEPVEVAEAHARLARKRRFVEAINEGMDERDALEQALPPGTATRQEIQAARRSFRQMRGATSDPIAQGLRGTQSWKAQVEMVDSVRTRYNTPEAFDAYVQELYESGLLTRRARRQLQEPVAEAATAGGR